MRYIALVRDDDGTLACNGRAKENIIVVVERFLASGRKPEAR